MSQYSSGRHDKLTADTWAPRPAFDRPLTNPANPIIAEFRAVYPGKSLPARIARYLRYIADPDASSEDDPSWTSDQRKHAREVLTRLAKFTEATS